jgi:hypothetical protein
VRQTTKWMIHSPNFHPVIIFCSADVKAMDPYGSVMWRNMIPNKIFKSLHSSPTLTY